MGYGKVLKEILDEKQMSVKTLSRNTGVPAPTIYSIIRRDTPIRYETALRFANTLDIPLATICNENPYNEEDKSLPEVGKLVGMSDQPFFYVAGLSLKLCCQIEQFELFFK